MPILTVGTKKVLYIHVPKTGGTSVERAMESYGTVSGTVDMRLARGFRCHPQHFHGELLRQVYATDARATRHDFDYVFMTVRDPLRRMVSEYRYQKNAAQSSQLGFWAARSFGFSAWVRYSLGRYAVNRFYLDNHFRPQSQFEVWSPEIFRLEDGLQPVVDRLDALTGLRGALPPEPLLSSNSTAGVQPSEATRRLVTSVYGEDFERYEYSPQPHR